jgi:hypothetical protein
VSGFDLRRPGEPVRFEIAAAVAGGRVRATGTATPLAGAPEAAAELRVAGVALAPLAPFLGIALAGAVGGEISARAKAGRVELDGQAALARFRAPGLVAEGLEWRGRASWTPARPIEIDGIATARLLAAAPVKAGTARFEGHVRVGAEIAVAGEASFESSAYEAPDLGVAAARLDAKALRATWRDTGWTLAADASAERATAILPQGEIAIDTVRAPALRARMAAGQGRVETPLAITGAVFVSPDLRARAESARAPGSALDFGRETGLAGALTAASGSLETAELRARFDALELELRRLAWTQGLAADFRASATGVALNAPDIAARGASVRADGRYRGERFEGQVAAETAIADLKAAKLEARAARASGDIAYDSARAALEGRARLGELRVRRSDGLDLAEIGALALDGIVLSDGGARVSGVLAERARALRREAAPAFPWRLEAPRLEIGGVALAPDGAVRVGPLRARGAVVRVTRTPTGVASLDALRAGSDLAAPGPEFRLESVAIDESRLEFEDRALPTPARVQADRVSLRLGALDTAAPATPTRASVRARVAGAGTIDFQGTATPLAPRIGFDVTGTAREVEMPPFSPYVAKALGVDLRTGRFDLDLRLAAKDEALSGTSAWRVRNLELDARGADALAREAGAPLEMALGFLRDGEGDIALDVPIAGRLDDPSFDTAGVVRQAVGGAIRGALSTTFNALFPFGFIFGALLDGQPLPALPPVAFAPGLAALDPRAVETLDALASVLAGRPAARLDICGFAGPADLRALNAARGTDPRGQELAETLRRLFARATGAAPGAAGADELRGLAEDRARAVKERLGARAGVEASRLYECRPVVETEAGAAPRVELKF